MTRLFLASTQFGVLSLASALDEGAFGDRDERRVLLTWNLAPDAEALTPLQELPGFAGLADRFDETLSLGELIAPLHPGGWNPPKAELPMLERLLRHRLGITDTVSELVVESLGAGTSATLASIFRGCPVSVYSDGLMTYGPTRKALAPEFGRRITRLLHLDLVPGLTPMLLGELAVKAEPIGGASFVDVAATLPPSRSQVPAGVPMIVGQYLSALEILTPAEENGLHRRMLAALAAAGHRQVVFKAHPSAGRTHRRAMGAAGAELGVEVLTADERDPVEALFRDHRPSLVVGCFSTALAVAQRFYDIPVATTGCELVLRRLDPFANGNRIPATIADAAFPRLQPDGGLTPPTVTDLCGLVEAVGYCMQPSLHPERRATAAEYVATHDSGRYVDADRLARVGIGSLPLSRRLYERAAVVAGSTARSGYADALRIRQERARARVRRGN